MDNRLDFVTVRRHSERHRLGFDFQVLLEQDLSTMLFQPIPVIPMPLVGILDQPQISDLLSVELFASVGVEIHVYGLLLYR